VADALADLRFAVAAALRDELAARTAINDLMDLALGNAQSSHASSTSGEGLQSEIWEGGGRGLIVQETEFGTYVARDFQTSHEIGRGEGMRGVVKAVLAFFLRGPLDDLRSDPPRG
jgi:hypothetical protein